MLDAILDIFSLFFSSELFLDYILYICAFGFIPATIYLLRVIIRRY